MVKLFLADKETLYRKIELAIRKDPKYNCNKFAKQSRRSHMVFVPASGIILDYKILSTGDRSRLYVSARSPWCLISCDYQDFFIRQFFHDIEALPQGKWTPAYPFHGFISLFNYPFFLHLKI